jgi:hypothetical protein
MAVFDPFTRARWVDFHPLKLRSTDLQTTDTCNLAIIQHWHAICFITFSSIGYSSHACPIQQQGNTTGAIQQ